MPPTRNHRALPIGTLTAHHAILIPGPLFLGLLLPTSEIPTRHHPHIRRIAVQRQVTEPSSDEVFQQAFFH